MKISELIEPEAPPFPFLKLPLEIRITIYTLISPNVDFYSFRFLAGPNRRPSTKFRYDGSICCPELLRANKQIYREAIGEFYGHACFQVILDLDLDRLNRQEGYYMLSKTYMYTDPPPAALAHVKHLKIHVRCAFPPQFTRSHLRKIYRICLERKVPTLESVTLMLNPCASYWIALLNSTPESLKPFKEYFQSFKELNAPPDHNFTRGDPFNSLIRYVEPLRGIRGLKKVMVDTRTLLENPTMRKRSHPGMPGMERMDEAIEWTFFAVNEVTRVMMLPRESQERV